MPPFSTRFGGGSADPDGDYDTFDPDLLPDPGPFLDDHDVLTGEAHLAVHRTTRDVFEARGVYDVTFGYNLAALNLDDRHPDAGYRYATDADDPGVLWAEFTPTTPFCPQSHTLTKGSFRAWNALSDRHDYDVVRVRLHPMHDEAGAVNDELAALGRRYEETGTVPTPDDDATPAEEFTSPF
ncbi:hypothetical protein [Halorarius halobius]|uniref:hypothetical protein n=1 Tax=Halorarius halobius TaxID=2962671 RepID=UPI0020CDF732|nr:hypothetical protein [Halorarius halobius]